MNADTIKELTWMRGKFWNYFGVYWRLLVGVVFLDEFYKYPAEGRFPAIAIKRNA